MLTRQTCAGGAHGFRHGLEDLDGLAFTVINLMANISSALITVLFVPHYTVATSYKQAGK